MVKAELSYNPYLQETKIRFNGRSPRVNSLVEKYQKEKLQDWLHKLPDIFRDEMNGYNFDLEFSGTKTDFEELKAAFKTAGIGDEQVHIFHKNELSERSDKMYEIEDLMNWLESHPNRRYDYSAVLEENKDLFEGEYEYLVLHGRQEDMNAFEEMNISVEIIEDVKTLEKTNLSNTPLLYVIDDDSSENLISDLFYLRKRKDVAHKQLFFRISPLLREDMVIRELKDLGVEAPQIVEKADDEAILRYFEVYPGSDSVREAIRLFNRDINRIREELKAEKEQKERANHSIYTKLDRLEEQAEAQKEALSFFNNPDKKDFEASYTVEKAQLIYRVSDWKNNKTKTTKVDEAMTLATEYSNFLCDAYDDYVRSLIPFIRLRRRFHINSLSLIKKAISGGGRKNRLVIAQHLEPIFFCYRYKLRSHQMFQIHMKDRTCPVHCNETVSKDNLCSQNKDHCADRGNRCIADQIIINIASDVFSIRRIAHQVHIIILTVPH